MPVKYLPTMRSLAKRTRLPAKRPGPKWKRTGLGKKGIATAKIALGVGGGAAAGALVAPKGKRKRAAAQGAVLGPFAGAIGGAGVGAYHRIKGRKKKKRK